MADAGPGPGDRGEGGGSGGGGGGAPCVAPLAPEQLRRVLEQVTPSAGRDPRAPRPPPPPQQLEAVCVKVPSGEESGQVKPWLLPAALQPPTARSGPQPAFRLLIQIPRPTLQPVPVKRTVVPGAPSAEGSTPSPRATSRPPAVPRACSGPVSASVSCVLPEHTQKLRKSLTVQTRSGRISRPPRHKTKDYKFIKTEDLADGRTSDSDDYLELSAGEEEEQRARLPPFNLSSCCLRPKMFRCQACDKAYIGRGGLARHLKLHPSHCPPEPGSAVEGHQDVDPACLTSVEPSTPAGVLSAQGGLQFVDVGEAPASATDGGSCPAPGGSEAPLAGPERSVSSAPADSSTGASLHELLQQCDLEQLVELVLPRLARAVTVYEFLLTRVRQGPPARPVFPAVYREFELLHGMVKGLCQDYVDSGGGQEPLDVSNCELAESLGIPEQLLRKDGGHATCAPACGPKRELEVDKTAEQGCTPAKRPWRDTATHGATEPWAAANTGPARDTESAQACRTGGAIGHGSVHYTGQQQMPLADSGARSGSEQPLALPCAVHAPRTEPGGLSPDLTGTVPQRGGPGHSPSAMGVPQEGTPCPHGPGGDLQETVLSVDVAHVLEPEPQLSTADPLGNHTGPPKASQGVTSGPPALNWTPEVLLLRGPAPGLPGGDSVTAGQVGGPPGHWGLPEDPAPSQRGEREVLGGFVCV